MRQMLLGNKLFAPTVPVSTRVVFVLLMAFTCVGIFLAVLAEEWLALAMPLGMAVCVVGLFSLSALSYLLLFTIPLSYELTLENGFATDLPTEQLMWLMTGLFTLYGVYNSRRLDGRFLKHPLSILLWLHLLWMGFTVVFAADVLIALKMWISKSWYVTACYLMVPRVLRSERGFRYGLWALLVPLMCTVGYVMAKHATLGFSFSLVNKAMYPFYRNHVSYACIMSLALPYLWWFLIRQRRWSFLWLMLLGLMAILIVAIQFSYTRTAYVAVAGAVGLYYVIRLRLMKWLLPALIIGSAVILGNYLIKNEYLNHNPDYSRTITHHSFDNLIAATSKGQDISTMERVYRWIAGYDMIKARPLTGFGPGNFASSYKGFTTNSFRTYVSDNKEGSGIHCYYLMVTVEQGVIGGILFLILCLAMLRYMEQVYWQTDDRSLRQRIMAVALSQAIILQILIINDMVETDKVGTFFFINLALLIHFDIMGRTRVPSGLKRTG